MTTAEERLKFLEAQAKGTEEKPIVNYAMTLERLVPLAEMYKQMVAVANFWHKQYNEEKSSKEVLEAVTIPVHYPAFRMLMHSGYIAHMMAEDPKFMEHIRNYYTEGEA